MLSPLLFNSFSIHRSLPLLRLAGYVEALASRLGMQIPDLSPKQADMWQTRVSSHTVGIETVTEFALVRSGSLPQSERLLMREWNYCKKKCFCCISVYCAKCTSNQDRLLHADNSNVSNTSLCDGDQLSNVIKGNGTWRSLICYKCWSMKYNKLQWLVWHLAAC